MHFASRNMSTYSNLKMGEIFAIYGNPFSFKNCKTNFYRALCRKYKKRVNFTSLVEGNQLRKNQTNIKDSLSLLSKSNKMANKVANTSSGLLLIKSNNSKFQDLNRSKINPISEEIDNTAFCREVRSNKEEYIYKDRSQSEDEKNKSSTPNQIINLKTEEKESPGKNQENSYIRHKREEPQNFSTQKSAFSPISAMDHFASKGSNSIKKNENEK